ncbi:hypothetical protein [Amycolatopsis taiwanensis]|uniref:Uncharacterized protein n=1 Tax=Amycolatopsis taiwanensis TaxID=342230 RepID=A0A9W6R626_9PSEU|nr:hypothetical protein [Amycolatopsis taiwanensis]GLY69015.1 hypothetical protein Atai01_56340 [Amycolatopsis taiwanensis]
MPTRPFKDRLRAFLDPRPARWRTVIVLGIVLGYGDGYVLVALTGAAGAIERTNHPFSSWLEESAFLVPLFILAELLVLRRIRRRSGPVLRSGKAVLGTALLIAVAGTVTGFVGVAVSAALDYRLQTQLIEFSSRFGDQNGDPLITAGSTAARGNCNSMVCNEERLSLASDARGVAISAPILLGVNVVLVGWVLAGFGGRLGAPAGRRATTTIAVPTSSTEKV